MNRLLTAAAALSLLAGATAFAQDAPASPPPAGGDAGMSQPQAQDPGASAMPAPAPNAADPSMGAPAPMASGAPASGASPATGAMDTSAAQTTDTPSAAPGSYPPCTHKGQDRCMQSAGAMKGGHHHKKKMG